MGQMNNNMSVGAATTYSRVEPESVCGRRPQQTSTRVCEKAASGSAQHSTGTGQEAQGECLRQIARTKVVTVIPQELDQIVARASAACVDPNAEGEGEDEQDLSMYCITCGLEIHARTAVRHMEKCFNKVWCHFMSL